MGRGLSPVDRVFIPGWAVYRSVMSYVGEPSHWRSDFEAERSDFNSHGHSLRDLLCERGDAVKDVRYPEPFLGEAWYEFRSCSLFIMVRVVISCAFPYRLGQGLFGPARSPHIQESNKEVRWQPTNGADYPEFTVPLLVQKATLPGNLNRSSFPGENRFSRAHRVCCEVELKKRSIAAIHNAIGAKFQTMRIQRSRIGPRGKATRSDRCHSSSALFSGFIHMALLHGTLSRTPPFSLSAPPSSTSFLPSMLTGLYRSSIRRLLSYKGRNPLNPAVSPRCRPACGFRTRAALAMAEGSHAPKHTNRLAKEHSPYLLQHAHNPVSFLGLLLLLLFVFRVSEFAAYRRGNGDFVGRQLAVDCSMHARYTFERRIVNSCKSRVRSNVSMNFDEFFKRIAVWMWRLLNLERVRRHGWDEYSQMGGNGAIVAYDDCYHLSHES
ncbi:hypothetical protein ACLOJK_017968 [Asimina triloba]